MDAAQIVDEWIDQKNLLAEMHREGGAWSDDQQAKQNATILRIAELEEQLEAAGFEQDYFGVWQNSNTE